MRRTWALCLCAITTAAGCGGTYDPHSSDAAEFVLQAGGSLWVLDKTQAITSPDGLPDGEYAIERIELNGTKVQDDDLKKLSNLRYLKYVGLYRTRIGDKGVAHLAAVSSLNHLELSGTRITDQSMDVLADLPNLQKLFIRNTAVTDKKVEEFQAAKPNCKVYH